MAKTTQITVLTGCIHYGPEQYTAGHTFECDVKEAKRLIAAGIAENTAAPAEPQPIAALPVSDLLAAISAVATQEELLALLPENEPPAEIAAAFATRMAELEVQ
jgi:hypothetical protein